MLNRRAVLTTGVSLFALAAAPSLTRGQEMTVTTLDFKKLSDAEWKQRLSPAAYDVMRREGTERAFTSPLNKEKRKGTFACAGCALELFSSDTKYDSRTGWPSFWAPIENAVGTTEDKSFGMIRTAVHCRRCGGHLGHVFKDGPRPTGLRYCMNGVAMTFKAAA